MDLSDPTRNETPRLEKVREEGPVDVVECPLKVNLQECCASFRVVNVVNEDMGAAEIVKNTTAFDEDCLVGIDQLVQNIYIRDAKTLEMSLAKLCTRLIGRKSLACSASLFFGIRHNQLVLILSRHTDPLKKLLKTPNISVFRKCRNC